MNGEGIDIYNDRSSNNRIRAVLYDVKTYGYSKRKSFSIGKVEKRMSDYAHRNGIALGSNNVYMSVKSLAHAQRLTKQSKRLSVTDYELIHFPKSRKKMKLYFDNNIDQKKRNFVYVSSKSKFIIHPNYEIKLKNGKKKVVNFITAQRLNKDERFDKSRFDEI